EGPRVIQLRGDGDGQTQSPAPPPTAAAPPPPRGTPDAGGEDSPAEQPDPARVPDAARINPPRVPKGMRAGHDISIEVSIDAGVPLEGVASATHEVEVERPGGTGAVVRLKDAAVIPNRDFVLRYDVAGGRVEDAVLAHASARGNFFTLILQPPDRVAAEDVTPKELVFVLDTSGSMEGFPIEKAKKTMRLALDNLYPQDTFNLITFAGDTHVLFEQPVPATPDNLSRAKQFISGHYGGGGTEMMTAIRAAFDGSDESDHVRIVCFMTDGQVGNDFEIISEVQKHPNARVFSMGFSSAPNRFLLDKLAEYGRGEVEYVAEGDDASKAVRRFHERIRNPLLTRISVEFEGVAGTDIYPRLIPDLFGAKPVALFGRYERGGRGVVRLRGKAAGGDFVREIPVELPEAEPRHDVLATLWARQKVDELMGQDMAGMQTGQPAGTLREEITRLGLDFRLMTQFTSFVAVEDRVVTDGGAPRRVDVPAETPASPPAQNAGGGGVDYSRTFTPQNPASPAPLAAPAVNPQGVGVYETVTVMASAAAVESTSSDMACVVQMRAITELPIKGRNLRSLMALAPGAVAAGGTALPGAQAPGGFSFNGQRPRSNSYVIDGVSGNVGIEPGGRSPGASASGAAPGLTAGGGANGLAPAAATEEFSVRADGVAPEFGRTAGAQVSVVTRSGSNELHGSLFGYFGDDALDANDWFANSLGRARQPRRLADYGGTLGGPLKRDALFFFGSYEGQRQRQPAFAFAEVPTAAARLAAPAALRSFLDAFPAPTGAARADGFAEFAGGFSTPAGLDSFSFRLDRTGTKLSLNARYAAADSEADGRGAGGTSLNTLGRTRTLAQTLTGGFSYVATPNSVWTVRANYSRVAARGSRVLDSFGGAIVPGADTQAGALLTRPGGSFVFDLGGRGAALGSAAEVANLQRQVNLVGSLDYVSGEHAFKFGADYRRLSPVVGAFTAEREVYFEGVAGAVAGTAARDGLFTRAGAGRPVFDNLSAYAQDEWKKTTRLTLTYGLRWELNRAPRAGGGR
ncbi:MAG TPA: VWA domain-containing protein, partial [Pyrinomonadaceae bacterium]